MKSINNVLIVETNGYAIYIVHINDESLKHLSTIYNLMDAISYTICGFYPTFLTNIEIIKIEDFFNLDDFYNLKKDVKYKSFAAITEEFADLLIKKWSIINLANLRDKDLLPDFVQNYKTYIKEASVKIIIE